MLCDVLFPPGEHTTAQSRGEEEDLSAATIRASFDVNNERGHTESEE